MTLPRNAECSARLDHEADELVRAGKYERTGDRKGYRSGHYERNFGTTSGEVKLRVPKLKGIQFETAIIERYKRRECSVENSEIRRRTRAIGTFPDGNSALMLVCARLRHVATSEWGSKRYMDMEHLFKMEIEQPADEENPYI